MTNIRRRLLAPPLTDSLPSGYTKLDYIGGYEGQIHLSDLNVGYKDGCYLKTKIMNYSNNAYLFNSTKMYAYLNTKSSRQLIAFPGGSSTSTTYGINLSLNKELELFGYPHIIIQNGVYNEVGSSNDMWLMSDSDLNEYFVSYPNLCKMYIYRFSTFDEYGDLKSDFIPCQNDQDGSTGLYDVINKKYYQYYILNNIVLSMSDGLTYVKFKHAVNSDITCNVTYWDSEGYEGPGTIFVRKGARDLGYYYTGYEGFSVTGFSINSDSKYIYNKYHEGT